MNFDCDLTLPLGLLWATKPNELSIIKNLYLEPSLCRILVKWLDLDLSLISTTTYTTWVWLIFYLASPLSLNLGTSMKSMFLERKKEPRANFCETKSDSCCNWVPLMPGKNHALCQSTAYLSICLKLAEMICSLMTNLFIVHLKLDWWVISGIILAFPWYIYFIDKINWYHLSFFFLFFSGRNLRMRKRLMWGLWTSGTFSKFSMAC